jgi:hypothetical protein
MKLFLLFEVRGQSIVISSKHIGLHDDQGFVAKDIIAAHSRSVSQELRDIVLLPERRNLHFYVSAGNKHRESTMVIQYFATKFLFLENVSKDIRSGYAPIWK